jgi:hypothetical protein
VSGADSNALAGLGDHDLAAAFGPDLFASADAGNGIADVMPTSLGSLIDPFLTYLLGLL